MKTLLTIAWRNLGRNRRRTFVTALAIAVGVGLCVATYGLMDGLNAEMVRTVTRYDLGHVQVHDPDYPQRRLMRETIGPLDEVVSAAESLDGVHGVSPRAYAWALVSKGNTSTGVELIGVDPSRERLVTQLLDIIEDGNGDGGDGDGGDGLRDEATPWPSGRELTAEEKTWDEQATVNATADAMAELDALSGLNNGEPTKPSAAKTHGHEAIQERTRALVRDLSPPPEEPPPLAIGDKLAQALKAEVGDEVYLITTTVDGMAAEERFRVAGVYHTGTAALDRTRAYLHLADLQRFVRLEGRVHEVALSVENSARAEQAAAELAHSLEGKDVLVRSWSEVRPLVKKLLAMNESSVGILLTIIFIVAALGVLNTMLMAVFERTREMGVLMALGFRPGQVRWLIVFETVALTVLGGAIGTLIGLGLDAYLVIHGWDLRSITGGFSYGGVGINPILRGAITAKGVIAPLAVMSVVSFLASFYPARRASKLKPTEAMRSV